MTAAVGAATGPVRGRLTDAGRLLVMAAGCLLVVPLAFPVDPLASLRLAPPPALLLLGSWLAGRRNLGGISAAMPAPTTDFEFATAEVTLRLRREGGRPAHDLLVQHGDGAARRPVLYLATLPGGEEALATVPMRLPGRGREHLRMLTLRSSWPFGLVRFEAACEVPVEVLALPRLGELRNTDALTPPRGLHGPQEHAANADSEEFHSLRAWRPGMSQRRVHWKSSARAGRLLVRETRAEPKPRMLVHLAPPVAAPDGRLREERRTRRHWETSIRLAGTMVEWLLREDHAVSLAWSGERPFLLKLAPGRRGLFRALGALADLPREPAAEARRSLRVPRGTRTITVCAGAGQRLQPGAVRLDPASPACRALFRLERRIAPRARMEVPA